MYFNRLSVLYLCIYYLGSCRLEKCVLLVQQTEHKLNVEMISYGTSILYNPGVTSNPTERLAMPLVIYYRPIE